jgi:hypothetical protein
VDSVHNLVVDSANKAGISVMCGSKGRIGALSARLIKRPASEQKEIT